MSRLVVPGRDISYWDFMEVWGLGQWEDRMEGRKEHVFLSVSEGLRYMAFNSPRQQVRHLDFFGLGETGAFRSLPPITWLAKRRANALPRHAGSTCVGRISGL